MSFLDDAVAMANAALVDCGMPPIVYAWEGSLAWDDQPNDDVRLAAHRACVLAYAHLKGERMVECADCVRDPAWPRVPNRCITIEQALKGITCSGVAKS